MRLWGGVVAPRRFAAGVFVVTCLWASSTLAAPPTTHGLRGQATALVDGVQGGVPGTHALVRLLDPATASSSDAEQLHRQASELASIAYLLSAAAEPLAHAEGSSAALLPHLTPATLRLYASRPGLCGPEAAQRLYDIATGLSGTEALRACQYPLFLALRSTFAWVRDSLPLRPQHVLGRPRATAAWPDPALLPDPEFTAALSQALDEPEHLGSAAQTLRDRCGLQSAAFALLVPRVAAVLRELHRDLPTLQRLETETRTSRWGGPGGHVPASRPEVTDVAEAVASAEQPAFAGEAGPAERAGDRRALLMRSNYFYGLPPNFTPADPSTLPQLIVPMVFHVLSYSDATQPGGVGPAGYDSSLSYIQRLEVHSDPVANPSLLLPTRSDWLAAAASNCNGALCLRNASFTSALVVDWPRSVNVFVVGDSASSGLRVGYAFTPGSDTRPQEGHVGLTWDTVSPAGFNSLAAYNDGPNTLFHETLHHFGVEHPFGKNDTSCSDDDYIWDTPVTMGPISGTSFASQALSYCMEVFWGKYGGDWNATYERWSTATTQPVDDERSWGDSCSAYGYDQLGNYLTYTFPVCFAAMGFLTPGQIRRAHAMAAELNPVMYRWAQYYAQAGAPPSPAAAALAADTPTPDPCKHTAAGCACRANWTYGGQAFSFCGKALTTSDVLYCPPVDPIACGCSNTGCILSCTATLATCGMAPLPSPEPSPSGTLPQQVPPAPPRTIPADCQAPSGSSGCRCRSTWLYGNRFYHYCANPNNNTRMWCQVTPECSSFDPDAPFMLCAATLSLTSCNTDYDDAFLDTGIPPIALGAASPSPSPSPTAYPLSVTITVAIGNTLALSAFLTIPIPFPHRFPHAFPFTDSLNLALTLGLAIPDPLCHVITFAHSLSVAVSHALALSIALPIALTDALTLTLTLGLPLTYAIPQSSPLPFAYTHTLTTPFPSPSPSPSPSRSPSPSPTPSPSPSPSWNMSAKVAEFSGTLRINASCALLQNGTTAKTLASDLRAELAEVMQLPPEFVNISGMGCGSVVANYTVTIPANSSLNSTQVSAAASSAGSFSALAGSNFTARWGSVLSSSSGDVVVYSEEELCPAGTPPSDLCPGPKSDIHDTGAPVAIIVGAAVGGGAALLGAAVLIAYVVRRRRLDVVDTASDLPVYVPPRRTQVKPGSKLPETKEPLALAAQWSHKAMAVAESGARPPSRPKSGTTTYY
ncbi:hypothetical protein HYH03_001841 [Edaphochlamys debaryana]|uniref:Kringle domain-containing protein n=1 Tax=Edaphochlamys debaryana TaxID=47281 RepID=A0A836C5P6_9CHLO|nr:hypothetical protein HYH03_001841 [Edaphochlamys debaryana]|eukprot:KAG2500263.1 hypothetical protein HYH03_001841 [Edaphochlamys debaryana]